MGRNGSKWIRIWNTAKNSWTLSSRFLARKLPSIPRSTSRCSASTPWMFGWNHRREDIILERWKVNGIYSTRNTRNIFYSEYIQLRIYSTREIYSARIIFNLEYIQIGIHSTRNILNSNIFNSEYIQRWKQTSQLGIHWAGDIKLSIF